MRRTVSSDRQTIGGKAGQQTIYLFHPEKDRRVLALLQKIMPKVNVEIYKPVVLKRRQHKASTAYREVGDQLVAYIESLPSDRMRVAIKEVRDSAAPAINSNSPTFRNARDHAIERVAPDWTRDRQSLVRRPREGS